MNPGTNEPVSPPLVYTVVQEDCYDDENNPDDTWKNQARVTKYGLTPDAMERRLNSGTLFPTMVPASHLQAEWQFKNVIWTDICNSVKPLTKQKANEMRLACKGGKGWMSTGCRFNPENMRGDPNKLKLAGSGTERIYWAPILTNGKLHVEILPRGFPGDTDDGAAVLIQKVRAAINVRFPNGAPQPRTIFVDRSNAFYIQATGALTEKYAAALREHGFKNFMGDNCRCQVGQMGDILLHETAVAWIRRLERRSMPARVYEETIEEFGTRMKGIVSDINGKYDVSGLCRGLPDRISALVAARGAKLEK